MSFNIISFVKEDIWLLHEQTLPGSKATVIKSLKIIILSVQGFYRDLCPLRASALTFYSIMSIVPIIAMLFGIAKGFSYEKILEQRLLEEAPNQHNLIPQLINFAQNLLESTKGEVVAGVGMIVLFWTIINVIGNIEESFNFIWKITKGRSIGRKFSDYSSLMLLAPAFIIMSSSISVLVRTKISWLITLLDLPEFGATLFSWVLNLSPLLIMITLFAFTFIFMPNHKINYKAGIIAGIFSGVMYHLLQFAYLSLQIGMSNDNAIYGSFAALPLFVIWLQTSWMIVLFGCEVAFFIQNFDIYSNNNRFSDISYALKKVIALQIMHLIIKNFIQMKNPLTAADIGKELVIPIAYIQPVLSNLISGHILVGFKNQDDSTEVYQPATDINILTIAYVINALEQCGQNHLKESNDNKIFQDAIDHFRSLIESSEQNRLLKDI